MTESIGGVIATAPLFNGVTPDSLRDLVRLLSDASGNFADDSTREWGAGNEKLRRFAETVNGAGLEFRAIKCLHEDKPQLVDFDQVMNAVLKDSRK